MSDKKYHVSHEGQEMGAYSLSEIVAKVKEGTFTVMDYLFDESKGDWVSFVEHHELMEMVKQFKPKAPPTKKGSHEETTEPTFDINKSDADSEWYVLKGENKFGPFTFSEMIKMLQEKLIFEFDFVWKPGLESWTRVAEMTSFSTENIKKLKGESSKDISELFFRRRHKRSQFNGTLLIHDNKKVWKGTAIEISAGGAGVVMENSLIVPGDVLYLHFKPCDGVPPFNAVCEIVSKKFVDDLKGENSPVRYGLRFTKINEADQKALLEYSSKAKSAA